MTELQRIAHRGYAGAAPENTTAAARFAAENGADYVEVDVIPTADGDVVVFHDARLDGKDDSRGITNGTGIVWETPTHAVTESEVRTSGETVPTLSGLCDGLPAGVGLNVELKHCGAPSLKTGCVLDPVTRDDRAARWRPFVADVLADLGSFDGPVLFSSFAEGALAALRTQAPDASLAPIIHDDITVAFELADRYDATAIHPSLAAVGISQTVESPVTDPIERAHTNGYAVNVWTVTNWYQARQLETRGADGMIADYPGLTEWRH
ncbi:MAG: glycerophosphodiester phosphodiesterase [Halobacteriales archaeon]